MIVINGNNLASTHNGTTRTIKGTLDQLGNRLNFKEMDAWYSVTQKQIHENEGITLLNKYGGSPSKLVMSVYDTHLW